MSSRVRDQEALINQNFLGEKKAWLFIFDAGRFDWMKAILSESAEFEGRFASIEQAFNGGHTRTTEWFDHHFPDYYNVAFFNGGLPMRRMEDPTYDEYDHFKYVETRSDYDVATGGRAAPSELNEVVRAYLNKDISERLEDLGYAAPEMPDRGIIRYMDPHRPYPTLQIPEGEGDVIERTRREVEKGDITTDMLENAYVDAYIFAVQAAFNLVEDLPGRVFLTSDHGECLGDCDQYYHGPDHDHHDHLVNVPWVVVK